MIDAIPAALFSGYSPQKEAVRCTPLPWRPRRPPTAPGQAVTFAVENDAAVYLGDLRYVTS